MTTKAGPRMRTCSVYIGNRCRIYWRDFIINLSFYGAWRSEWRRLLVGPETNASDDNHIGRTDDFRERSIAPACYSMNKKANWGEDLGKKKSAIVMFSFQKGPTTPVAIERFQQGAPINWGSKKERNFPRLTRKKNSVLKSNLNGSRATLWPSWDTIALYKACWRNKKTG